MDVLVEAKPLKEHGTNQWSTDRGGSDSPNVHRGDNPEYIASRLKRDHPDIAAAVERGEYLSMRQAGIAAGIASAKQRRGQLN